LNFIPVPVPPPLIPPVLTYWMTECAGGGHYMIIHKWLDWGGGGGGGVQLSLSVVTLLIAKKLAQV
jgi:hypothetical protein